MSQKVVIERVSVRGASPFLGLADDGSEVFSRDGTVPAPHTSQRCHECGRTCPDNRDSQAVFRCVKCGHTAGAGTNAARNIRTAGMPRIPLVLRAAHPNTGQDMWPGVEGHTQDATDPPHAVDPLRRSPVVTHPALKGGA